MLDNNFGKRGQIFNFLSPIDLHTLQRFPPYLQYVATLPC